MLGIVCVSRVCLLHILFKSTRWDFAFQKWQPRNMCSIGCVHSIWHVSSYIARQTLIGVICGGGIYDHFTVYSMFTFWFCVEQLLSSLVVSCLKLDREFSKAERAFFPSLGFWREDWQRQRIYTTIWHCNRVVTCWLSSPLIWVLICLCYGVARPSLKVAGIYVQGNKYIYIQKSGFKSVGPIAPSWVLCPREHHDKVICSFILICA